MKTFLVTEQVLNEAMNILAELPAKKVFNVLDALRQSKVYVEKPVKPKKEKKDK